MKLRHALTLGLLCSPALLGSLQAEIPWRREKLATKAENVPSGQLLRAFAAEEGLSLQVTDKAVAPVSGDFQDMPARSFLDAVCDASDLIWFWDGTQLHIDAVSDSQTKLLTFEHLTTTQSETAFKALGFESGPASHPSTIHASGGLFTLSGGARYLAMLEPVLKALDAQEAERLSRETKQAERDLEAARAKDTEIQVRVFRLTHAYASDINVKGGTSQTVIPGVARALQNILGMSSGAMSTGSTSSDRKRQLTGLRGEGLAAVGAQEPEKAAKAQSGKKDDSEGEKPMVQADPRLNAVIVRDTAARMAMYESLIKQLDIESPVIEISASVVDIDANNDLSAGVEFLSFGDNGKDGRIGFDADRAYNTGNGSNTGNTPAFVDGTDLVRGSGFSSSALVPVGSRDLLIRIRALEQKGEAQLLTSPSVITLENVEASLRQEETMYVKVAGYQNSDLFDVHAGVQLRVTPSLVKEGEHLSFRLIVEVQDGSFTQTTVDGVPSTKESAINTQAVVPSDRTLLIGGYFVENHNKTVRQIPLIGNIPYVGALFRRTSTSHTKAQRFFFITPRLVDVQKEARDNRPPATPPAPAGKKAKAKDDNSPEKVTNRANELAGHGLPYTPAAPATAKP